MYRIQAHNVKHSRFEVIIVDSMDAKMKRIRELRDNPDYGLVTVEYNPRGSFYR